MKSAITVTIDTNVLLQAKQSTQNFSALIESLLRGHLNYEESPKLKEVKHIEDKLTNLRANIHLLEIQLRKAKQKVKNDKPTFVQEGDPEPYPRRKIKFTKEELENANL